MPDVDARLLANAQATTPADPGVRECWGMIIEGVKAGWLDGSELKELIDHLQGGRDFGVEELMFEHLGDELRVSFLDDEARCDPAALRVQLAQLIAPPPPAAAPLKRATTVPPAARAAIQATLRKESEHADALPDPLPVGRVLNLFDKSKSRREQTRILGGQDAQGFFLDYYRVENDGTTSWHGRIRGDGTLEDLENFEGQFGIRAGATPADTQRERQRVGAHNAHVREVLQRKGFL